MARHERDGGFTIVEILVVIAIISVLAGLLMTGVLIAKRNAMKKQTKIILAGISIALESYKTDMGDYPPGSGDTQSAETLFAELTTAKGFGPYYTSRDKSVRDTNGNGVMELVDAWGNPILYTRGELLVEEKEYELVSTGADGVQGTEDDVVM
ncbi:MAG: type II secretion system protein GspG [Planctomycetes bacterium]|nr:type II secretion system protein GspG [Planctomycetota bacterium]